MFLSPIVTPAHVPATDTPPVYSPSVAAAITRGRDRLLGQIGQKLKQVPARSLRGSLYVLLAACVRHYSDRLTHLNAFRTMARQIESGQIASVPQFVAALPHDLKPARLEALGEADVEQARLSLRMLEILSELRAHVSPDDHENLVFYDRLRERVEDGVITSFGQFAAALPEFITNFDDGLRSARAVYLRRREVTAKARQEFMNNARQGVSKRQGSGRDSSSNLIYQALGAAVLDFAELELYAAWWNLMEQNNNGAFESPIDFMHFVPEPVRPRLSRIVAELVAQAQPN